MSGENLAPKLHQGILKQGNSARRPPETDSEPFFFADALYLLGKESRDTPLILFQNADPEALLLFENFQHLSAMIDAHQYQRRIERDRREGTCRHAMYFSRRALSGNDRYSRGKLAQGLAKLQGGGRRGKHS